MNETYTHQECPLELENGELRAKRGAAERTAERGEGREMEKENKRGGASETGGDGDGDGEVADLELSSSRCCHARVTIRASRILK